MTMIEALQKVCLPAVLEQRGEIASGVSTPAWSRVLMRIFETLDLAGIKYCVLHGYDNFAQNLDGDVDAVVERDVSGQQLLVLFQKHQAHIGAKVILRRGRFFIFAGQDENETVFTVPLDLSEDGQVNEIPLVSGREILKSRRRCGKFWVPSPELELVSYLARAIAKGRLDRKRTARLSQLYLQGSAEVREQVKRHWHPRTADVLLDALHSQNWQAVRDNLRELQTELRRRSLRLFTTRIIKNRSVSFFRRANGVLFRHGLGVAFLGPDGSGKSSIIESLNVSLVEVFPRSKVYGFTPEIVHRLRHGAYRLNHRPHSLPSRSTLNSVVRAIFYWGGYYTLGYWIKWLSMIRGTLVMNDRHFADVLVDPKRYRYGGPAWLIKMIWMLIPKPDIIILLDAPADIIHKRKQEVPLVETCRQRSEYLALVTGQPNGYIVDAALPLRGVSNEVTRIILGHLANRMRS